MDNLYGIEYLRKLLLSKQPYVKEKYDYYWMKYRTNDLNISSPPKLTKMNMVMGWCEKAVDTLADRINLKKINPESDVTNSYDIIKNYKVTIIDKCILDSIISSCSFAYVYVQNGNVKMQPIDGINATGIIDEATNMLKEGYAVLERDKNNKPTLEAYFTSDSTTYYYSDGTVEVFDNPSNYPTLIPFIYRPSTTKSFGRSKISRACIDAVQNASRTVKRAEITGEFYSYPQKWIVGTEAPEYDEESEEEPKTEIGADRWKATMSSFMEFFKNEDGSTPTIGQFQQASVTPHLQQLEMYASLFGGYTNLTMNDLGFPQSIPSSQETIKAMHEGLRADIEKAQIRYEIAIQNLCCVASSLKDNTNYSVDGFRDLEIVWQKPFATDTTAIASLGDGLYKLKEIAPNYIDDKVIEKITGIEKAV